MYDVDAFWCIHVMLDMILWTIASDLSSFSQSLEEFCTQLT